jgi:ribosome-binding protein aMBF1 (putative translation factor)
MQEELRTKGMSQSELARRTKMHNSTVNLIVRGRMVPYDSQLVKIAAALEWTGEPAGLLEEVPGERPV